jgi:hypothetical protein
MSDDDDSKAVMQALKAQNELLMARLKALEESQTDAPAAKKKRRGSHPRTKPKKAAPAPRRSPRNHSPARTPAATAAAAAMLTPAATAARKLSFTSAGKASSKKKRNTPTTAKQLVRKTLGDAIKLNMDELLVTQYFRDANRFFRVEEFSFRVQPLIDVLIADDEVDTSMYSPSDLLRLAVNIGKKRDKYEPKKQLNATKKRKLRIAKSKKRAAKAAASAAAAAVVAAAGSADDCSDDDGATEVCAPATRAATEEQSDSNDLRQFLDLDADNQRARDSSKEAIAGEKKKATERKRNQRIAIERATAKTSTAAGRKKAREAAAAEAHNDYVKKMAAVAVAASRRKSESMKKVNARKLKKAMKDCALEVGMKVTAQWADEQGKGDWYNGTVVSIEYANRTVFVKYDDGDTDDSVPWENTRIIDNRHDNDPPSDG